MLEVPVAHKYHGDAGLVAGLNRGLVLNGAARLDYGGDARLYALLHAVGDGKERIGRQNRPLGLFACAIACWAAQMRLV